LNNDNIAQYSTNKNKVKCDKDKKKLNYSKVTAYTKKLQYCRDILCEPAT